jgi:F0F1-type ATP synthase assembly protein I
VRPQSSIESERRPRGGVTLAGTMGGYVVLCILIGLGLGLVLDRAFNTGPWFLIGGVVLGFIASFGLIYRLAMSEVGE